MSSLMAGPMLFPFAPSHETRWKAGISKFVKRMNELWVLDLHISTLLEKKKEKTCESMAEPKDLGRYHGTGGTHRHGNTSPGPQTKGIIFLQTLLAPVRVSFSRGLI